MNTTAPQQQRKLTDVELAETVRAIRSWVRVCKKADRADHIARTVRGAAA